MMLCSPALQRHIAAGARVLDWGGWQGPAVYTTLEEEVKLVRNGVGLADYPFLSHYLVAGADALSTLQRLCTRDLAQCEPGRSCYTLMLDANGRPIDDGVVMRLAPDRFIVTVPGRKPTSFASDAGFLDVKLPKAWLTAEPGARVAIYDLGAFAMSVQGPLTPKLLSPAFDFERFPPWSVAEVRMRDIPVLCVRTGYSGERGVELLVWPEYALELWDVLVELGRPYGARPFGLEATMTLGFEKGFLNANDFYPDSTPLELGVDWLVARDKPEMVGSDAVLERRRAGLRTRLIGLELEANAPAPKPGTAVRLGGRTVGAVTNAAYCPTFGRNLARAWLLAEFASAGTRVIVDDAPASVAPTYRWYDPENSRLR